jgi:hypothetical protein
MIYLIRFSGLPLQGGGGRGEIDHRVYSDVQCLDAFLVTDSWRKQKHVRLGWHYAVKLVRENYCALQPIFTYALGMYKA